MQVDEIVSQAATAGIDERFGDPWDGDNPLGFSAILAADEKGEAFAAGERVLDEYNLNSEFVPLEYGGKLTRIDRMVEVMRAVYRRDPGLGLGYGGSSLLAAVNVWTAGNRQQCQDVANILLQNKKIACSYYELPHGSDLANVDFEALPHSGMLWLNGSKQITSNIQRADAMIILARTKSGPGSRCHSQLFIRKSDIASDCMDYLPRFSTVGMRGVQLGGINFYNCPVPESAVLGSLGQGLETAMKSFQITRTALPGMFLGILDTALRTAVHYAKKRHLYGRNVIDLPQVRSALTECFVDLLLCDCFSTVVSRAIHVLPGETSVYAPAVKYLVPSVLIDAVNRLSGILGSSFYLRKGEYAIFQKLVRDVKPAGFGHIARAACLMSIIPQLPRMARISWLSADPAPAETFRIGGDLPPLSFSRLSVLSKGKDSLMASLVGSLEYMQQNSAALPPNLPGLTEGFVAELRILKEKCLALKPNDLTIMADQQTYDLASRYTILLAASASINIWLQNKESGDTFLNKPLWLAAVLARLDQKLNNRISSLPDEVEAYLFSQLLDRYENSRSLDLSNHYLPGWH